MERTMPLVTLVVLTVVLAIGGGGTVAGELVTTHDQKATQCCQESYMVDGKQQRCVRTDGNYTTEMHLNCTHSYMIFREIEQEVYVDETGSLVDGEFRIQRNDYCVAHTHDGESTQPVFIVCFNMANMDTIATMLISKGIMMLISVFFLLVTLYIYYIIPDLRETQDKVTSAAVGSLAVFMFLLSLVQLWVSLTHTPFCTVIAFLMYFFLISYFAWLNMVMANVWKLTVARRWKIRERSWYILNHIYAITVAVTLTTMVYIYHSRYPTLGEISCWFRTEREQSYFVYLPLSVMLSINIFLFVWTSLHLHASGDDLSPDRKKSLRYKCMLYLKLFLLSGLIWVFEILSFHMSEGLVPQSWFWIIVDAVNCLHGVLIFFVLIVWRQRIKRELANRWVFCFRAPARWAELKDDEQEHLHEEGRDTGKYDLIIK
ncbi:probable G-protein coupled receptor Mth-like 11 [Anopheles arabiensis]|uniref:probable G-protein coupled receptor Mth-like 11 n=1 Tax=Anopheles arabiensis TaxID=7173 RepID=UPI001AACCB6D|nr:probable G-protein coupled receptor Mth-like 11 [Anopheles arabiensis]XP_040155823.1 probable G-protein coupled receptor Mth-like 11 [Anopheles arabiensis]XP_040155824.1 probable G-protein coupled receptor Mth-like 11 [Anopheles arabiensis]